MVKEIRNEQVRDCDYVRTVDNDFYIVKGHCHYKDHVLATHVFEVSKEGDRENTNGLTYQKVIEDTVRKAPRSKIVGIFKPEKAKVKRSLKNEWKKIYDYFLEIGIKEENVGVFGSNLIGFSVKKDVDFVIYGLEGRDKVKQSMEHLKESLGFNDITAEHISYQEKKYSRFHDREHTNFTELLKNKWSSIQIRPGLLSTVRFGFKAGDVPEELEFIPTVEGRNVVKEGKVIDARFVDYTPRVFRIETGRGQKYWVKTLFWSYQSCVKEGDQVVINGVEIENDTIGLVTKRDGVRIVN